MHNKQSTTSLPLANTHDAVLNIVWEGSQFVNSPTATANREHCWNILQSGIANIAIVPDEPDDFGATTPKLASLQKIDVRNYQPDFGNQPVAWIRNTKKLNTSDPLGAKWIIQFTCDSTTTLTDDIINTLEKADEIWTPSQYSRSLLIDAGINSAKVQVIPQGIDPTVFTPVGDVADLPTSKKFKILFVGSTTKNNGFDILLETYCSTFSNDDDVTLIIKTLPVTDATEERESNTTENYINAELRIQDIRKDSHAPEILFTDAVLSDLEMAQLYRACNVFALPYRSVSFPQSALESMACGTPVIASEVGSIQEIISSNNGFSIDSNNDKIPQSILGLSGIENNTIANPSTDHFQSILIECYNSPQYVRSVGLKASLTVRSDWTWARSTLKVLSRLDALYSTTMSKIANDSLPKAWDSVQAFCYAENALERGRIDDAIEHYHKSFLSGSLPTKYMMTSLHRLATLCIIEEDGELCEEYLRKAELFDTHNVDTLYLRSMLNAYYGEWKQSLEYLTQLLHSWEKVLDETQLNLTLDMILCDSARALFNTGAIEEARELYTKALEFNADNADACYGVALCFKGIGAVVEAKTMLEWAVRISPQHTEANQELQDSIYSVEH